MSKRLRLRLTIDALDDAGGGVGAAPGSALRVHVPFALPGETVVADVEHESPHRPEAWGTLVEVTAPSPDRVAPACTAWGRCGGCALQHLAYGAQLAHKRDLVERALSAAGIEARVGACVAANEPPRPYRNRAKLVFAWSGERAILGAYEPRSHRVVDLAGCRVVAPPLDEIATAIARLATTLGVPLYDERSGSGIARYAILRSTRDGATQVMLVVAARGGRGVAELARALVDERPEVRGVVENLQPSRSNVLIGEVEPDVVLAGEPHLFDAAGAQLRLSPRSFFQASWAGAEALYRRVQRLAGLRDGEVALDLYSGVGGVALLLARESPGAQVVGVEGSADAIGDAEAGRALNRLDNVRFVRGDVAGFLGRGGGDAGAQRADVVVVDPPRRGLEARVVEGVAALGARRIVYLSCDPGTLARDLAILGQRGYRTGDVEPFDLMPDTSHVEAIASLASVASVDQCE